MSEPPPGFRLNTGVCPEEAKGKRVRVILANGNEPHYDDSPTSSPGWAADGKGGCRWTKRGLPFDIAFYLILGAAP